jgi:hypothetical protein
MMMGLTLFKMDRIDRGWPKPSIQEEITGIAAWSLLKELRT